MATITWPTAITPRVQRSYGCQFNMLLISRSHEDENTDLIVTIAELPSCDQKLEWDFECGNVEATEGGEQTSWGSGGRCKPPSGVRGGAPEEKIRE